MQAADERQRLTLRGGLLPLEVDAFVGRRAELDDIRRQLGGHPVVTLVGPGGVGKTRLALRAASQVSRNFRDGVRFADPGTVEDAVLLASTIAQVVGLQDQSGTVTLAALIRAMADRRMLLVLDNCEHLVEDVAAVASGIAHHSTGLRILATSRERLGIAGEAIVQIAPMTVPRAEESDDLAALPRFEAVSPFAERARSILPEFALTERNGADIARICREVDGIPLALELAAARLRTQYPVSFARAERMPHTGGWRPQRQQELLRNARSRLHHSGQRHSGRFDAPNRALTERLL